MSCKGAPLLGLANQPKSVNITGLSPNIDWNLAEWPIWRNEYGMLLETEGVFPQGEKFREYNYVLV